MKRWQMYNTIHGMKNQGFSKRQIAEKLKINFRTVSKYLEMEPEEYNEKVLNKERQSNLDYYEGIIRDWIKHHPDMTAAQVEDWLKEHYQVTVSERTVRRYVNNLRKKYAIPKTSSTTNTARQYEAIEDPPMGKQMQVDIGIAWALEAYKRKHIKLYCIATVLSHSRYKWGIWQARPLTTRSLIQALQICFESMGGMPKELVFDQDRILAVDENYGDIIYTKEFEQFRLTSGFEIYLCRGSDPQSKGRIESVVKYFKNNYAKNRQYMGIDIWNEEFEDWLERTGNAKVHGTTKKIPAKIFEQEKLFLKPVPSTDKVYEPIVTRDVHKNNTIFYEGNRYTVPLGTYSPGCKVSLSVEGDKLIISDVFGENIITEHTLSKNKGELVVNNNHKRDTTAKLDTVQDALWERLHTTEEAEVFLTQIRKLKQRYARDQFALIEKVINNHNQETIHKALNYCITHSLFSAVEFRNAAQYFKAQFEVQAEQVSQNQNVIIFNNVKAAVSKKRELAEYARALKGGEN